jgi:hypothetical protein
MKYLAIQKNKPYLNLMINPPKTKIKYSPEGPNPGHLRPNGFFGYKCQSKTQVTKFEVIVAQ